MRFVLLFYACIVRACLTARGLVGLGTFGRDRVGLALVSLTVLVCSFV